MVIYLEEAVARRRVADGGVLTHGSLREAVVEGALLRLRPKVMTVSTVVAGLLPIMWSTRVGAEVMKPIAAPVLGGMVSSLLHVLLVTPVIFFWLRSREIPAAAVLEPTAQELPDDAPRRPSRRVFWIVAIVAVLMAGVVATVLWLRPTTDPNSAATAGQTIQQLQSGPLKVELKSDSGALQQGRTAFVIEFRSATGALVDAGDVRLAGTMTMPGMAMSGGVEVHRTDTAGRYQATADFGMAGAWRFTLEWNGPAGSGSLSFNGDVR